MWVYANLVVLAVAVALGLTRVFGVTHIAYQAVAHLFVGGLFGAWLVNRRWWLLATFIILTVLETVCAVVSRLFG